MDDAMRNWVARKWWKQGGFPGQGCPGSVYTFWYLSMISGKEGKKQGGEDVVLAG